MKKVKLLTTLLLSGASVAALASCGTNTYPGANKPGVSVLLNGEDSSKYLSYEVVGGEENLKFGETDVVVNITPNKFYSLYYFVPGETDEEKQYWGRSGYNDISGDPSFNAHVYLGSRNSPFRYELAENIAWTSTNNSEFEEEQKAGWNLVKEEKFEIKVKKEFFQKAITINIRAHDFEDRKGGKYYYHTLSSTYSTVITEEKNGCVVASDDKLDEAVTFSRDDSDFTVLNDNNSMVLVYDINSAGGRKKLNAENGEMLKNELLSFNGYDQLDKDKKYSKFEVIGVKKSDHTDETLSVYDSKKKEQDFEVEVTNAGNRIIFYLKWTSLIDAIPGDPYNEKYEDFKVKLTPSPILDVKVTYSKTPVEYQMQNGFYNKYMVESEVRLSNFSRSMFTLQYDSTNKMTFENIAVSAMDNGNTAPYFVFVKGKESTDGNPTWPTVDITYEDINGKTITQPIGTTAKESTYGYCLKYCENYYWRIVCINSGENAKLVDPWSKKNANNLFVIYPLYSTSSFYVPDGSTNLAKSVTINVGNI